MTTNTIYTAQFSTIEELGKFYRATSGVDFVGDAYEFLGCYYCVKFTLGIQTEEIAQAKIRKANGVIIRSFD